MAKTKPSTFEIVVGTYEEYLLGYNFQSKDGSLSQSFAAHDHSASLRAVSLAGHYLASGAADDRIIIYDFKTRKEHCMLTHHESTITSLKFTNNHSHLISASSDGVLAIVRVGNWQLEKKWEKAHKGLGILDIAVHSSGKLALTLGSDSTLRTWNLVKGRQAYAINLNSKFKDAKSIEKIAWADDDVKFVLYGGKQTDVWSIETGGSLQSIEHEQRVSACSWHSSDSLIVGYEDGQISIVDATNGKTNKTIKAHEGRVKAINSYDKWIVTVSSNGEIKVWSHGLKELAKCETGCRITCLGIVPTLEIKKEDKLAEKETVEEEEKIINKNTKRNVVVEVEESDEDVIETVPKRNKQDVPKRKNNQILIEEQDEEVVTTKKNKKQKLPIGKKKIKSKNKKNSI